MSKPKIAYLIPEFPGQTHNFFWKEKQALESMGYEVDLISTRRPHQGIMSQEWSETAQSVTEYLYPLTTLDLISISQLLVTCGPGVWMKCFHIIFQSDYPSIQGKMKLLAFVLLAAKLFHLSMGRDWKHVHVHSCADSANIALLASQLGELTYSLTLHNPLSIYGRNQKQKWSQARFGLVITQEIYNDLKEKLSSSIPQRLKIVPMGVDCEFFVRSRPYLPATGDGDLKIFCCGRLNYCKGHQHLILVVSLLREQGIPACLTIAGEDERGGTGYRKELEAQVMSLDLQGAVDLPGAVSAIKVREYLENSHLFILASLSEPLGVAIMEAMSMEIPTIGTRAGGVPELIDHGVNGILVPPEDPDAIVEAVKNLISNPDLAMKLSRSSREKILKHYQYSRSAYAIDELLMST